MRPIKFVFPFLLLLTAAVFFPSIVFGQTKTDAELFAIWKDKSKPETVRLDAFWKRIDTDSVPGQESTWWEKWNKDMKEAIELAIKNNKKGYLPLLYRWDLESYYGNKDSICITAKKVIETAKVANASKKLFVLDAYFALYYNNCDEDVKEEDVLKEFNKEKNTLSNTPADLTILREITFSLGEWFGFTQKYPKAINYLLESLRISEELHLIDISYAKTAEILGGIHTQLGNYKEAEKYLDISLEVAHALKDTLDLGSSYLSKSNLMIRLKDEVQAQRFIDSALYVMKNVKHCEPCYYVAKTYNAGVKNLSKDYVGALDELNEVETYFNGEGKQHKRDPIFFTEKARAYLGLKKYDSVIKTINAVKVEKQKYNKGVSDNYELLSKAYEGIGDYNNALKNYKLHVQTEDTLAVWRNSSEATRLELENQFTQQQLKSQLDFQVQLNRQKSTRNWIIILGISGLLLALGLYAKLRYTRRTQKLLQQKNEIIEAEKVKAEASEKAKQQFLANMSHEIRTPMNAIKGMTDILIRRNPKEDQKEYLEGIKQSSDSLLIIINDILDLSKIEAGKIELEHEPFSVNELVNSVHNIMQFKAEEKGLELKIDFPVKELTVKGDANRLRQILINLIGNAIKFTEKGMVATTILSESTGAKLNLHFIVSDTGIGIDEDRKDKIFESFEQAYSDTSRKFGGTGLGLSISKKLIELHNGKIWVESEKGKGSQFHFIIPYDPVNDATKNSAVKEVNVNVAGSLKGIRILLVEDNQFNAVVAQEELEDAIEDIKVEVAENGAIAVEKLKLTDFDVILMDVQMPVMNGYAATSKIRALDNVKANTPIIAMTANVLKEELELCQQAGMNDFIGKPFDTGELIQKIYTLKNTKS
ncbi:MAG: response regulator [Bacteroidetes bacterium]|nr:response regulator [Bacteroidota bacterium]